MSLNRLSVILLDINMTGLCGWDVLSLFGNFPERNRHEYKIYLYTSAIITKDKQIAKDNPGTKDKLECSAKISLLLLEFKKYFYAKGAVNK